MDKEGQKYKVAYSSDRYTENRDKQFCTESLPSLEASGVFSAVLLHLHAWTYEGQVGLHDFVCSEAYSVSVTLTTGKKNLVQTPRIEFAVTSYVVSVQKE